MAPAHTRPVRASPQVSGAVAGLLTISVMRPGRFSKYGFRSMVMGVVVLFASFSTKPVQAEETPSPEAKSVLDWVLASADNQKLPFLIIDKVRAMVFVFHADGQLHGASPALLGSAVGDDSAPGIGDRKLSDILPKERTTPAGRFVASLSRNLRGEPMLWVEYETALSMHPVVTGNPRERRAQRLATPTPMDNRISFGCINVPAAFFIGVVTPAFNGSNGVVYILPETRSIWSTFKPHSAG